MRIESLTFFRFIAAVIVVCFHFGMETSIPLWLGNIAVSGAQMVTFFFVLSGFVMLVSHYDKQHESLANYYLKRLARIMPVYLLALVPFVLVYSDPLGFLLSLTFTQAWLPPYALQPNIPGWSLSVEMFFYLLFPWLLYGVKRYRINARTLLLLALGIFGITQGILSRLIEPDTYQNSNSLLHNLIFFFPLSHLCSFLLGMAAGKLLLENTAFFNSRGLVQLLLFSGALMTVYLALNNPNEIIGLFSFRVVLGASFFAPLFALLILAIACSDNLLTRLVARPAFVFLGEISFGVYILQFPVHELCERLFPAALMAHKTWFFITYLLTLIVVAAVIYRWFEMPCRQYLLKQYLSLDVTKAGLPAPTKQPTPQQPDETAAMADHQHYKYSQPDYSARHSGQKQAYPHPQY